VVCAALCTFHCTSSGARSSSPQANTPTMHTAAHLVPPRPLPRAADAHICGEDPAFRRRGRSPNSTFPIARPSRCRCGHTACPRSQDMLMSFQCTCDVHTMLYAETFWLYSSCIVSGHPKVSIYYSLMFPYSTCYEHGCMSGVQTWELSSRCSATEHREKICHKSEDVLPMFALRPTCLVPGEMREPEK